MSRFVNRTSITSVLVALTFVTAFAGGVLARGATTHALASSNKTTTKSAFCAGLGKKYQASSGAQMYCFGAQPNGPTRPGVSSSPFGSNVDAANPHEDVSPSGVQSYGQSETSIAGVGPYAIEAWNDSTAFFSSCGAPMNKEEATGFGFSANGGKSFTDKGGLPNANCTNTRYGGDPSVEAWHPGGTAYFYISSLFNPAGPSTTDVRSHIAMAACKATGTGPSALISCSQPIIIASSSLCTTQSGVTFCSFLDKDFLSIDPVRGRLYATYTEFFFNPTTGASINIVELAVCDIGTSTGGTGPAGGTAATPICFNGSRGSSQSLAPPYLVIAPTDVNGCENEGAYPAINVKSGDVYAAYEHNWATSLFGPSPCFSQPVQNVMNFVPFSCLKLKPTSPCSGPAATKAVSITSLQGAFIPGYNRFPMNDFPRIAVSDKAGTVSMVWNDARFHLAGDILLQSFKLMSLSRVQSGPVRLNRSIGGWHFLPSVRNADEHGNINVSWYSRGSANTAFTDVTAALSVNPRITGTPTSNTLVTTRPSNWNAVSSDSVPNFGDYTDNYVMATGAAPFTSNTLYVAWSDGRTGDPQPFEAHTNIP